MTKKENNSITPVDIKYCNETTVVDIFAPP